MSDAKKKESLQDRVLAMRGESREEGGAGKEKPMPAPRKCRITIEEFLKFATDLVAVIEGQPTVVHRKVFQSGSFGWFVGTKMEIMVNGQPVRCQMTINMTAIGSKPDQVVREE